MVFSKNIFAVFLVLAGFLCWNFGDAFLNHMVDKYTIGVAALFPALFYFLFLIPLSPKFGGLKPIITTTQKPLLFLRALFGTMCFLCFIQGLLHLSLALTYTLILTSALWVSLYSALFQKEKIGLHRISAIIIGFIGVVIAMKPDSDGFHWAVFAVILSAIFYAAMVIVTKKIGENEPLINMVFYPLLTDITALLGLIIFFESFVLPDMKDFLFFAFAGLFYLIGTAWTSKGYASGDSSLLAPLHYSQIIWGALIGYFFFSETPTLWTILGAGLIVLSGIYMIYREHKAENKVKKT